MYLSFPEFTILNSAQVTQQLTDGVRMLQMQAHENSGDIYLCHTACVGIHIIRHVVLPEQKQALYNGGTLLDYLKTGKKSSTISARN